MKLKVKNQYFLKILIIDIKKIITENNYNNDAIYTIY